MEGWYHTGRRNKDGSWSNGWGKPPCETLFYEVVDLDAYSSMCWERWWDRPIQEHERRAEWIRAAHSDGSDQHG
jgi:hypothetical protein